VKAKCLPVLLFIGPANSSAYAAAQHAGQQDTVWSYLLGCVSSSAFWTAIFTLALTISTALLWWQTKRLAEGAEDQSRKMAASIDEMRRSADAATETAKAVPVLERAYVFLDNRIRFQRPTTWSAADTQTSTPFSAWLINYGKTPAVITQFIEMHRFWPHANPEIPDVEVRIPRGEESWLRLSEQLRAKDKWSPAGFPWLV
jgi:hypothetical protein